MGLPGDYDLDGDIDTDDFNIFEACASGPNIPHDPGCEDKDFDEDNDADQNDFAEWQKLYTGSCDCPPAIKEPPNDQPGNPLRTTYLFSGEFYTRVVDLRIKGRGFDFVWARKYRSRIGSNTEMGNGWDYSYNRRIEQAGPHIRLYDGNSRADVYRLQPNGTWTRPEFFRVLNKNPNGTYTLTFADKLKWNFKALDGSAAQGKISSSVDRTGNSMTFEYDGLGRLTTIRDTLDGKGAPPVNRAISVAYNGDGLIASVTDWMGRSVTYEYYDGIEAGGNLGDLKSVTSPTVTGTPNGNNFPLGKTTVYTYSTGFVNDDLNHNLLTITDPKGQQFLTNTYSATVNPNAFDFDHLETQVWGEPGDRLDAVYVPQTPHAGNNFAVVMAVVNDRVGNVEEQLFDRYNRCVIRREYTGRAPDPDAPTTIAANRPTGKLRPSDPAIFETSYSYNEDAMPTQTDYPNGNSVQHVYELALDPNAPWRSRGNLRERHQLPGPLGGDQVQIDEYFEYDPVINFDHNFITRQVDGRTNQTTYQYDSEGNRTHAQYRVPTSVEDWEYNSFGQVTAHILPDNGSLHRRRDEFTYHTTGSQVGYLQTAIVDAGGLNLTTAYTYDSVGNVTSVVDPGTLDTLYTYNALDQVVRRTSREVTSGVRYQRDTFYDANNNVVRVDLQNKDDQGVLQANTHFSTINEYDILNYPTRTCSEVGNAVLTPVDLDCASVPAGEFITTDYKYDANRNRTLVRYGEATKGTQPNNMVQTEYDERDLVYRVVRAPGVPGPGGQSTDQVNYDGNGNVVSTRQGIESAPRITNRTYDGFNRLKTTTDPMGNVTGFTYDANGNQISARIDGELTDVPGSAGNLRLYQAAYSYDALDRLTTSTVEFFDTATQAPIDDGQSVTTIVYNDNSQVLTVTDDNSHATTTTYDLANRLWTVTDAKGNIVTHAYDANSNVTATAEVDKSDLGNPDETFITGYSYDGLDRRIRAEDNLGNIMDYSYDSRGNLTATEDALRPLAGDPGNITRYSYDGLNRLIETEYFMTDDGTGTGTPAGSITTAQSWDDTSRLASRSDGNGNVTSYTYDALNRLTVTTYADTTVQTAAYEVHHNRTTVTDANGSVQSNTYDLNNRLTDRSIALAAGVLDTTVESYAYDGLGRLITATDDDSTMTRTYDSLSRVTSETLNGQTTSSIYDGVGNQLSLTYPGGRVITCTYDALNRKSAVSDVGGLLGRYNYLGPARVERRLTAPGAGVTVSNWEWDGIRRITRSTHVKVGSGAFDDRTYVWDKMSNNTQRNNLIKSITFNYAYDSIYRLVYSERTPSSLTVDYDYDDAGNRNSVTISGGLPKNYTLDPTLPEPADLQMNQYTTTPNDTVDRKYDQNGNLKEIDFGLPIQQDLRYDYRDLLVRYVDTATVPDARTDYKYDALGRRIEKVEDVLGTPVTTRFFYNGSFMIEEQDGTGTTVATYVEGAGP
ncbi:MAG: DUF6531 domain-containing protein [Planctomycetota bacterium]